VEGKGNVYAPNYASLGSYSLQGNFIESTLPLRRLELRGGLSGDRHNLNWIIDADEQVIEQVLEMSTDGVHFTSLIQPGNDDRTYSYKPLVTNNVQYRMNVTFDNGRQYYSNVITLRVIGTIEKPILIGNLVTSNTITVSSPGNFDYTIYNFNGNIVTKGRLINGENMINAGGLINGMYIIRFSNNEHQWMEKLVRQ
jgi:hypothetical protein